MSHAEGVTTTRQSHRTATRARVEQLQRQLTAEIETIQSGQDWQRLLDLASRLHRYSANNLLLIAIQHAAAHEDGRVPTPTPTHVAGFHTWKMLGRSVDKGQQGYAILAPAPRTLRIAITDAGTAATRRPLIGNEQPRSGERVELEQRLGWKIEHVFDVCQTSGRPLPEPPRPHPMRGRAPHGLIDELTRAATVHGYTVGYSDDQLHGADGVTRFDAKTITVRPGLCEAGVATTLAHELGHVLLHDPHSDPAEAAVHRGVGEVEAESVAYIIGAAHGMDTSGESLPYVATWAGGRTPADVVQATAQRVVGAAHQLLTELRTVQHGDGTPPGLAIALEQRAQRRAGRLDKPRPAIALGFGHA